MFGNYLCIINKTKKKIFDLGKIIDGDHGPKLSSYHRTSHGIFQTEKDFLELLSYILFLNRDDDIMIIEDGDLEDDGKYAEFVDYDVYEVDFEWYFSIVSKDQRD